MQRTMTVKGNKLRITILAVLLFCVVIGRCVWAIRFHVGETPAETENVAEEISGEADNGAAEPSQNGLANLTDLTINGVVATSDTPWGFNAGEFDMEDGTHCILLMPDTSADVSLPVKNAQTVTISWMIHPWVSASSDGVGVVVEASNDDGTQSITKEFSVKAGDAFEQAEIDISELQAEQVHMNISCN